VSVYATTGERNHDEGEYPAGGEIGELHDAGTVEEKDGVRVNIARECVGMRKEILRPAEVVEINFPVLGRGRKMSINLLDLGKTKEISWGRQDT
jgi:hypothetical protein